MKLFQSTPSAWRVTCRKHNKICRKEFQSTPSAWRVTRSISRCGNGWRFQSTPSAWRVTFRFLFRFPINGISIHTLRMEGDVLCRWHRQCLGGISIHTLRMEGDQSQSPGANAKRIFQSTPSAWRVTGFHS